MYAIRSYYDPALALRRREIGGKRAGYHEKQAEKQAEEAGASQNFHVVSLLDMVCVTLKTVPCPNRTIPEHPFRP